MIMSSVRIAVLLTAVGALNACAILLPAEAVSLSATDKTLEDHLISVASGKDCSVLRYQHGRTYCKEDELNPSYDELYCYRNLGGVTCYNRPAFDGSQPRIGNEGGQAPVQ